MGSLKSFLRESNTLPVPAKSWDHSLLEDKTSPLSLTNTLSESPYRGTTFTRAAERVEHIFVLWQGHLLRAGIRQELKGKKRPRSGQCLEKTLLYWLVSSVRAVALLSNLRTDMCSCINMTIGGIRPIRHIKIV